MTITLHDVMRNSFVITDGDETYTRFCAGFARAGFIHLPTQFKSPVSSDYFSTLSSTGSVGRSPGATRSKSYNHTSIVRLARALGMGYVAIFESDAYPRYGCVGELDSFLSNHAIPDDAGILSLGSIRFVDNSADPSLKSAIVGDGNSYMRIVRDAWGSHAVVVFKCAYDEYIQNAEAACFANPPDAYERLVSNRYCTPVSFFAQAHDGNATWVRWYVDKDRIPGVFGLGMDDPMERR